MARSHEPRSLFSRDNFLKYLERSSKDEDNPLYAWWAFVICRERGAPLPKWVLAYLDHCAANLLRGELQQNALGLKKSGHKFRRFETTWRNLRISMKLESLLNRYPQRSVESLIEQLASEDHFGI